MAAPSPSPRPQDRASAIPFADDLHVRSGRVPRVLGGCEVEPGRQWLSGDAFLLRTAGGLSFFYRKGEGIVVERPAEPDAAEESLWLNGSVYSAVAAIHGYRPIHASAVAFEGQVFAFTGPSGAGKSTLVAGLGQQGFPLFCDDTLVLDLRDPDRVICLPGHKRLKLTRESLDLTGATPQERVAPDVDKHYAAPPAGALAEALPLAELVVLAEGAEPSFAPLTGGERFTLINDDHYTTTLFEQAQRLSREEAFALRARLARQVAMARFSRPLTSAAFTASTAAAARHIREWRPPT